MIRNADRTAGIDLARTISILGVVLVHTNIFTPGRFGVQLFFLVSGYLLADLGNLSTRDFFIRRGFRLFPLYWLFLCYYVGLFSSPWQLLVSVFLLQNMHWVFVSIPGSWSISNEWLFSLALPFLKRITRNQIFMLIGISWICQILTSILVYKWGGTSDENAYQSALKVWINTFNPLVNFAFLLIGIAIKKEFLPILRSRFVGSLIICLCLVMPFIFGFGLLWLCPPLLWAVFTMCLTWAPQSKIVLKFIGFIGQRTYGIYFFHFIVLSYVLDLKFVAKLSENYSLGHWLEFIFVCIGSTLLSEISWRFVERPSLKISKRFLSKMQSN
jgi:peptidoglycan/LPS O-acetylase OafA/YrhL